MRRVRTQDPVLIVSDSFTVRVEKVKLDDFSQPFARNASAMRRFLSGSSSLIESLIPLPPFCCARIRSVTFFLHRRSRCRWWNDIDAVDVVDETSVQSGVGKRYCENCMHTREDGGEIVLFHAGWNLAELTRRGGNGINRSSESFGRAVSRDSLRCTGVPCDELRGNWTLPWEDFDREMEEQIET